MKLGRLESTIQSLVKEISKLKGELHRTKLDAKKAKEFSLALLIGVGVAFILTVGVIGVEVLLIHNSK